MTRQLNSLDCLLNSFTPAFSAITDNLQLAVTSDCLGC